MNSFQKQKALSPILIAFTLIDKHMFVFAEATLAHEVAGHGYFQATGKNPYNPNDYDDNYPREKIASSIENQYRASKGWPQRQKYGVGAVGPNNEGWDLDQWPQTSSTSSTNNATNSTNNGGNNSACSNH